MTAPYAADALNSKTHETCPSEFFSVPVYPQSKLCLPFSESLPASMSYHADSHPDAVQDYYVSALGEATSQQQMKGRLVMTFAQGSQTIIISPDGSGSQVDILVKN